MNAQSSASTTSAGDQPGGPHGGLRQGEAHGRAAVRTDLSPDEVLKRLDTASRRGRLAGFEARPAEGILFTLELHGSPFDGVLTAGASQPEPGQTEITFKSRMLLMMPLVFAVVLIATVWPGVYFMDRFLPDWQWIPRIGSWWPTTWWWYVPLTAIPLPLVWRALMRRSRDALRAAAVEAVERVAREVDGRIVHER
jgi:hypothetical protein